MMGHRRGGRERFPPDGGIKGLVGQKKWGQ